MEHHLFQMLFCVGPNEYFAGYIFIGDWLGYNGYSSHGVFLVIGIQEVNNPIFCSSVVCVYWLQLSTIVNALECNLSPHPFWFGGMAFPCF